MKWDVLLCYEHDKSMLKNHTTCHYNNISFLSFCFINWFIYIYPWSLMSWWEKENSYFVWKILGQKKKKKYTNFATTHQVVSYNKSYIMFCTTKLLALFIFYYWNLFHHTHVKVGQTTMHVYFWSYDPYNKSCDLAYSNKFMSIIFF